MEFVAPAPTVSKITFFTQTTVSRIRHRHLKIFTVFFFSIILQSAPLPTENAVQCRTTTYGCCFDRVSIAAGPNGEGCPDPPNHSKDMI